MALGTIVSGSRRQVLKLLAGGLAAAALPRRAAAAEDVPVRTITRGPHYHWFGYYDKLQFSPDNRYVLGNQVTFEGRSPTAEDAIKVGMVDTANGDTWIELGSSNAWGWQQGCMLQWRPEHGRQVVWNDRQGDRFVCHILDLDSGQRRTIGNPIYALSPDGKWGVGTAFERIQNMRPGYGYAGVRDPHEDERAPADSGIYRIDLDTGESALIVSLADVVRIPHDGSPLDQKWHYFNHLLVSPDGERFIFLHRWRDAPATQRGAEASGGFTTRMFTARTDGSDLYVLDLSGKTSHFIWRDPEHICAWTQPRGHKDGFYLFRDRTREVQPVGQGVMTRNGHNTYLPLDGAEWILNDTYPVGEERLQNPYLYHVPTKRRISLGHYHSPPEYQGEWRCDLHPRSSNDAKMVCIDSPHTGAGRQMHLIDISRYIG